MSRSSPPSPIVAYCERAIVQAPAEPRGTLLEQAGEMRLAPDRPWMPFTAVQSIAATRTEVHWHARCKMAPWVTAVVDDGYQNGRGRLDARLWGVVPLAHGRGLAIDRGERQRYLAELAWCPSAMLHNPQLQWRVIDEQTVRTWIDDETVHMDLSFDAEGDIVAARTDKRARDKHLEQPWEGRFFDYQLFEGLRAPAAAEVAWGTPGAPYVYWRGRLTSLRWA